MMFDKWQRELFARNGEPELADIIEFVDARVKWLKAYRPKDSRGSLVLLDDRLEAGMLMGMVDEHMRLIRSFKM